MLTNFILKLDITDARFARIIYLEMSSFNMKLFNIYVFIKNKIIYHIHM